MTRNSAWTDYVVDSRGQKRSVVLDDEEAEVTFVINGYSRIFRRNKGCQDAK